MKNVMILGGITGAFAAIILGIYIFTTSGFKDKLNVKPRKELIRLKENKEDTVENKFLTDPKLFFDYNTDYFQKTANDFISEFKNTRDSKDSLYFYMPERLRTSLLIN